MKTLTLETKEVMNQLLTVLDTDIQHLEDTIAALDQLRCLVVKQDDDALGQLLNSIQSETKSYHGNELKRQVLRKELAVMYNCGVKQITLSRFGTELTGEMKLHFIQRKMKLQTLAGRLKKEYANTQKLLTDCARFNRVLLKSIFNVGRSETTTYDAAGSAQRQTNTVFMNLQL